MSLFKINRGKELNLPTTLTDGWAYFTTDDHNFYIDYLDNDNSLVRAKLSSEYAEKLRYLQNEEYIEINVKDIMLKQDLEIDLEVLEAVINHNSRVLISNNDKITIGEHIYDYTIKEVQLPICEIVQDGGFAYCDNLEKIVLNNCRLLKSKAFANCKKLKEVYLLSNEKVELETINVFDQSLILSDSKIYVPSTLLNEYQIDSKWSVYLDKLVANVD